VAIGQLMETLAAREAGRPDPYPSADRSAGYGQGRTVPPLRGGALIEDQTHPAGPAGALLRQPMVREAGGAPCRLDERLGRGFAVVGRRPGDLALGAEAQRVLERLGGSRVCLEGLEVTEGAMDHLFDLHPAAVVRPDRYVFGVVDAEWDLDRLLLELARRLSLR
jgi:hypothetical protein